MKKKLKKNKNFNQISFYFEDYLETNKNNKILKKTNNFQDRIYLLFFFFFSLVLIFSIKITFISLDKKNIRNLERQNTKFCSTVTTDRVTHISYCGRINALVAPSFFMIFMRPKINFAIRIIIK